MTTLLTALLGVGIGSAGAIAVHHLEFKDAQKKYKAIRGLGD